MRGPVLAPFALIAVACTIATGSISGSTAGPRMSPEDILTVRTFGPPQIAPDGSAAAFVVREARPDRNAYVSTFAIASSGEDVLRTLAVYEKGEITSIRWTPDGRSLTYLSTLDATQLWNRDLKREEPEVLFRHSTPISQYEWSPDGNQLAFVTSAARAGDEEPAGIVYDPDEAIDEPFRELTRPAERRKTDEVWLYDVRRHQARRLWQPATPSSRTTRLVWAPDGGHLTICFWASTQSADGLDYNFDIVSARDGSAVHRVSWPGFDGSPAWSPNGRSLAFVSEGDVASRVVGELGRPSAAIHVLTLADAHISRVTPPGAVRRSDTLHWSKENRLYSERHDTGSSAGYRIEGNIFETEPSTGRIAVLLSNVGSLSSCSFATAARAAACIKQDLRQPPEIALVDLAARTTRTLTSVNVHLQRFAFAPITERRWKNRYGHDGSGYLLTPDAGTPPYPTLIVLYGFSKRFVADAQWISSYPVETLAAQGFAVMLMNWADHPFRYFDSDDGLVDLIHSPLDTVATAVDMLVKEGTADPRRLGILGWSRGCYITALAIGRSDAFKAASCGDGYLWTPGRYWLTRGLSRFHVEAYFGGPPYGDRLARYEAVSPIRAAEKVGAAVLFEYVAENFTGLELYVALRRHKVAAEYVAYPGESHVFVQPRHRLASMHRNLDWFKFWLLGQRDDAPSKRAQYVRWEKLKQERH